MKSVLALDLPNQPGFVDLTGQRFGRLIVLGYAGAAKSGAKWFCRCDCGAETTPVGTKLRLGRTVSCGCHRTESSAIRTRTHGLTGHALYATWCGMRSRCANVADRHYGGRGIAVCKRWSKGEDGLTGFECFLADMGTRPAGHTIDRIDNDGNYEPGNCRWAPRLTQTRNRSITRSVHLEGRDVPLREACEIVGLPYKTVHYRLQRGWSDAAALGTPVGGVP